MCARVKPLLKRELVRPEATRSWRDRGSGVAWRKDGFDDCGGTFRIVQHWHFPCSRRGRLSRSMEVGGLSYEQYPSRSATKMRTAVGRQIREAGPSRRLWLSNRCFRGVAEGGRARAGRKAGGLKRRSRDPHRLLWRGTEARRPDVHGRSEDYLVTTAAPPQLNLTLMPARTTSSVSLRSRVAAGSGFG